MQLIENENTTLAAFERRNELGNGYLKKTLDSDADITNKMLERIRKNSNEFYERIFPSQEKAAEPTELLGKTSDDSFRIIMELLQSNRDLVIANKDLAAANLRLATDHGELVQLAKQAFNFGSTSTVPAGSPSSNTPADHQVTGDLALDKKDRVVKGKSGNPV